MVIKRRKERKLVVVKSKTKMYTEVCYFALKKWAWTALRKKENQMQSS